MSLEPWRGHDYDLSECPNPPNLSVQMVAGNTSITTVLPSPPCRIVLRTGSSENSASISSQEYSLQALT